MKTSMVVLYRFATLLIAYGAFDYFCRVVVVVGQQPSPCPDLFKYEERSEREPDRWYGTVVVKSDVLLHGLWLRLNFDRPVKQLGNWFGEVMRKNESNFLVKRPDMKIAPNERKQVRFFVRYDTNEDVPSLVSFFVNARMVCPEGAEEQRSTTPTNQLFTSDPVDETEAPPHFTTTESSVAVVPLENLNHICGTITKNDGGHDQVTGIGEFPWHVALYYNKAITISYLCSGSLISQNHVLCSAHCVVKSKSHAPVNIERLLVYLGKHYVRQFSEGVETAYVSEIIAHPHYSPSGFRNDLALLVLSMPVTVTDYVRPICLPDDYRAGVAADSIGTVVGWGFNRQGQVESELMKAAMTVKSADSCGNSIAFYSSHFSNQHTFCATFANDARNCVGDSGGGFALTKTAANGQQVRELRGVITISVALQAQQKCDATRYVVFTDVGQYLDWIRLYVK